MAKDDPPIKKAGRQNENTASTTPQNCSNSILGPSMSEPGRSSSIVVLSAYLVINCLAAVHAPIQDCDEVYNYWEPTHYLNHGFGFQTWEYSPEYAIRSWLYIVIHAAIGRPADLVSWALGFEVNEFIWTRLVLAAVCAFCQLRLFQAVHRHVGSHVAVILAFAMVTSPGMFYASVAFLPSSFSMYTAMMGIAAFLEVQQGPNTRQGIKWFGMGAVVGWPFSAALIVPLMLDELFYVRLTGNLKESAGRIIGGVAKIATLIVSWSPPTVRSAANDFSLWISLSMRRSFIELSSPHGASSPITSSATHQRALTFLAQSLGTFIFATFS